MSRESDCKVYVGDLLNDVSEKELERAFNYYGPIRNIWIARNPPGFAFVEFNDPRDAEDAIDGLDGSHVAGSRIKVEPSRRNRSPDNERSREFRTSRSNNYDKPRRVFNPNDTCYECGERGHYAYDCPKRLRGNKPTKYQRSRSRSRSHERRRSYSRSVSRSRSR